MNIYSIPRIRLHKLLKQIYHKEYHIGLPSNIYNNDNDVKNDLLLAFKGIYIHQIICCSFEEELLPYTIPHSKYIINNTQTIKNFFDFYYGKSIYGYSYAELSPSQKFNFNNIFLYPMIIPIKNTKDCEFLLNII